MRQRLPFARAGAGILLGVIGGVMALSSPVLRANEAPAQMQAQRQYDVPAGTLDKALQTFASQAGVMLSVDAALTASKTSPGLKGAYTIARGFELLLAGSGLEATEEDSRSYSLRAQTGAVRASGSQGASTESSAAGTSTKTEGARDVRTLGKIEVQSGPESDGSAEQGYRSDTVSAVGPWQGRSLQDMPYSIAVIPEELIQNLQATSPDQIYRIAPTVQFLRPQSENDESSFNLRGFLVRPAYRDGLPTGIVSHGTTTEDSERVEIFTGLSGFLYGPGNVGGLINYIGKRSTAERLTSLTLGNSGGSNYYAQADFGGPIDRDGRFGYRLNGTWQDGEIAIDDVDIRKHFARGAFDWHVTDTLLWEFDAAYRDYEVQGGQAHWFLLEPAASRPAAKAIGASEMWGAPWVGQWFKTRRYSTQLRWDASERVTLRTAFQYNNIRRSYNYVFNGVAADGTYTQFVAGQYASGDNTLDSDDVTQAGNAFADFKFRTGAIDHKLTAGAQYMRARVEQFANGAPFILFPALTLDRPPDIARPVLASIDRGVWGRATDTSYRTFLIGDDITFSEHWSLLAGVARSTIDINRTFFQPNAGYEKSAVTPNVSVMFKPFEALTAYATYIEALEKGGVAANSYNGAPVVNRGEVMKPLITDQIEIGAKWSVGGVLLTTALFQIDKGLEYYDVSNASAPRFVQSGRQVHRGVELTAFGKVTEDLTLTGGFTILDAQVEDQKETPALEGKLPINVAKRFAKLRAEYRLPALPALSVSGGVSYNSYQFGDQLNTDRLPSYTVFDAGARYSLTAGRFPLSLRLDVLNLTDKDYWSWSDTLGDPRTVMFSVSMQL